MAKHVLVSSFLTRSGLKVWQNSPQRCPTQWIRRSNAFLTHVYFKPYVKTTDSGFCNVLIINSILDCNCKLSSCHKQTQSAAVCVCQCCPQMWFYGGGTAEQVWLKLIRRFCFHSAAPSGQSFLENVLCLCWRFWLPSASQRTDKYAAGGSVHRGERIDRHKQ